MIGREEFNVIMEGKEYYIVEENQPSWPEDFDFSKIQGKTWPEVQVEFPEIKMKPTNVLKKLKNADDTFQQIQNMHHINKGENIPKFVNVVQE